MASEEDIAKRRARVLTLRAAGMSPADIAEREARETGEKPRSAHAVALDIARALRGKKAVNDEQRDLLRTLELERLDALQRTTETLLAGARHNNEHALALRAVDRLLRIAERRAALQGLDDKGQDPVPQPVTEFDEIKKRRDRKMKEMRN